LCNRLIHQGTFRFPNVRNKSTPHTFTPANSKVTAEICFCEFS